MGIPFFNIGGTASIDRLAKLCQIGEGSRVLEVGCGTGANACYLAERYGCTVVGVDISKEMVKRATLRAEEQHLSDQATFMIGDAYDLRFSEGEFDVVLTVFVSQFLDPAKAFLEFHRVLKEGGYLGVNEMYRADDVPPEARERVDEGVREFCELTELPFTLRSPGEWDLAFESARFTDVTVEEHPNSDNPSYSGVVDAFGGWRVLIVTLWRILVYYVRSGTMRKRFATISRVKTTLLRNEVTSRYIGYVLCSGKKP